MVIPERTIHYNTNLNYKTIRNRDNKVITNGGILNYYSSYSKITWSPIPPPRKIKRMHPPLESIPEIKIYEPSKLKNIQKIEVYNFFRLLNIYLNKISILDHLRHIFIPYFLEGEALIWYSKQTNSLKFSFKAIKIKLYEESLDSPTEPRHKRVVSTLPQINEKPNLPVIHKNDLNKLSIEQKMKSLHLNRQIEQNPLLLTNQTKTIKHTSTTVRSLPSLKNGIKNNKLFNRRVKKNNALNSISLTRLKIRKDKDSIKLDQVLKSDVDRATLEKGYTNTINMIRTRKISNINSIAMDKATNWPKNKIRNLTSPEHIKSDDLENSSILEVIEIQQTKAWWDQHQHT